MTPRVDILLATYNGAKYLPAQLASLHAQTHDNWRLLVRDDGSEDDSLNVVRQWAVETRRDVQIIEDGDTRLGPAQSFGRLLSLSDAPYFAFCDQDDHWRDTKIARLVQEIQSLEKDRGTQTPILVHSDLEVVDANLQPMGVKFWEQARISNVSVSNKPGEASARSSLLLQNVVTGCALLGNAELRRRATPMPETAHLHDWWVALIAAYFGTVRGVAEPLIHYRQHGGNTIGAKAWDPLSMLKRFLSSPLGTVQKTLSVLAKLKRQTKGFVDTFPDSLSETDRPTLEAFAALPEQGFFHRKAFMLRYKVYPQSFLRGLVLFLLI